MNGSDLQLSKSDSDLESSNENLSPNIERLPPEHLNAHTSPINPDSDHQNGVHQTMMELEQDNSNIPHGTADNPDDNYLIAVAGSREGRSSRATDADDSSLGDIGEDQEEEEESDGDYIELPALTKPSPQTFHHPISEYDGLAVAKDTAKNDVIRKPEEKNKVRGRSNSLFKILGRRQKLVEEAEQKRDQEKLEEGSQVWIVVFGGTQHI